jgi:hypothetical protein
MNLEMFKKQTTGYIYTTCPLIIFVILGLPYNEKRLRNELFKNTKTERQLLGVLGRPETRSPHHL